jgi:hypothetical protein
MHAWWIISGYQGIVVEASPGLRPGGGVPEDMWLVGCCASTAPVGASGAVGLARFLFPPIPSCLFLDMSNEDFSSDHDHHDAI